MAAAAADPWSEFSDAPGGADQFAEFSDAVKPPTLPADAKQTQAAGPSGAAAVASAMFPAGSAAVSTLSGMATNLGATGSIVRQALAGNVHNLGDASRIAEQYKAAHQPYTPPPASAAGAITSGLASPWDPLNWPGAVLDKAGEGLSGFLGNITDSKGNRLIPSYISTAAGPIASGAAQVGLMGYGTIKGMQQPGGLLGNNPTPAETPAAAPAADNLMEQPSAAPAGASAVESPVNVSPDVQAMRAQVPPGLPVTNESALMRHLEDKSLPYPTQLTAGQATQNIQLISDELNGRATPEGIPVAERLNAQNGALVRNLNAFRDQVAPEAGTDPNPVHGQTLMDAYEATDAAANKAIAAKYNALTDANGGDFPVDGPRLIQNIDGALKAKLKTGAMPPSLGSSLNEFRDGTRPMTFEDFETLRSDAATAMRDGTGSEKAAAGIVRQQLEQLPLTGAAAELKPLADAARQAAAERFAAIDADPAYDAVVNGTAKSNTFASKYVLNAAREHIEALQDNIGDSAQVREALGAITTNQLRARAGIDAAGNGNFSAAGYNKGLEALRPNLDLLVDDKTANGLNTLGNVSRYVQAQPKGSWVNNSNSTVAAHGLLATKGADLAEHGANMLAHGVPVGSMARGAARYFGSQRAATARAAATNNSLMPFAGSGAPSSLWNSFPTGPATK